MADKAPKNKADTAPSKKVRPPVRRGGPARALAALTGRLTRPLFAKRGFADGAIVNDWSQIAGEAIAAHSLPDRITFQPGKRRGGTLHLKVAPGGFALELQYLEKQLIERINSYFGYGAIERIHMVQEPLPALPPVPEPRPSLASDEIADVAAMVANVEDDELREHLKSLGQGIKRRRKAQND